MKILLLSRYSSLGASSRLRCYQYIPYLESCGFKVEVAPFFKDEYIRNLYSNKTPLLSVFKSYVLRLKNIIRANKFEIIWVEKEMLPWIPAFIEFFLLHKSISLVVDYDDAVFHRYDQHRLTPVRKILGCKIDRIMQRADLVVVGNDYLGDRAKQAGARKVVLLPTVVDPSRYTLSPPQVNKQATIGWIGSPSTAHYLNLVVPALQSVIDSHGIRVVAIGAKPEQLKDLPIEVKSWSENSEVNEIKCFDIGIMPLPDEPFERGKCGYKLIQYMACAKPVIASPVGVNSVIVLHGVSGFLASSDLDWIKSFRELLDNKELRLKMGMNGRTLVEKEYSLQVTAPILVALLCSLKKS